MKQHTMDTTTPHQNTAKNIETKFKQLLQVPATISKVSTMSDGGLRIQADTQEIGAEDAGLVMMLKNKLGWLLFAEQAIDELEVIDLPKIETDDMPKSPSEYLRGCMFVYFTNKEKGLGKPKDEFNDWYKKSIDKIAKQYLEKMQ